MHKTAVWYVQRILTHIFVLSSSVGGWNRHKASLDVSEKFEIDIWDWNVERGMVQSQTGNRSIGDGDQNCVCLLYMLWTN